MDFIDFIISLFTDYTTRTIGMGTAVLGIASGTLGAFTVLRKQSLLGDAIAHASLPGIALAFLITGIKNPFVFFVGAALSGWLATLWIMSIVNNTRIKSDAALGVVLAVFFGVGLVLLTYIQKLPNANQAGLETFLFGQAATLIKEDVIIMLVITIFSLLCIFMLWKEFKLVTFDPQFARSIGYKTNLLDFILNTLIVLAIVLGLQTVGVVLMSALLIAPAAAARQWTDKLGRMVVLSAIFGALSGLAGTAISSTGAKISTGPTIVLSAVFIVFISFMFAPRRGLIAKAVQRGKNRHRLALNKIFQSMYEICKNHDNPGHKHSLAILKTLPEFNKRTVRVLQEKDLISIDKKRDWCLTAKGLKKIEEMTDNEN
nr:metal ABC transporter permease [Bacteroidota bacterium]